MFHKESEITSFIFDKCESQEKDDPDLIHYILKTIFQDKINFFGEYEASIAFLPETFDKTESQSFTIELLSNYPDKKCGEILLYAWVNNLLYQLFIAICSVEGRMLQCEIPKRIVILFRRQYTRYSFLQNECIIDYNGTRLNVISASFNGLSFEYDNRIGSLKYGDTLSFTLYHNGNQVLELDGLIRSFFPSSNDVKKVGLFLNLKQNQNAENYYSFLMKQIYQNIVSASEIKVDEIFEFLKKANYLVDEKLEYYNKKQLEINTNWSRIIHDDSLCTSIAFYDKEIYGFASSSLYYSKTWLLHHLAAIAHSDYYVPEIIFLSLVDLLKLNQDIDYIVTYYRKDHPWTSFIFNEFANFTDVESDISYNNYHYYSFDDSNQTLDVNSSFECINKADIDDLKFISSFFQENESEITYLSKDHNFDDLCGYVVSDLFKKGGFERDREIFVMKNGKEIRNFIIFEKGSNGINLHWLYDVCYLYYIDRCNDDELQLLLEYIKEYYKKNKREKYSLFLTQEFDERVLSNAGFYYKYDFVEFIASYRQFHIFRKFTLNIISVMKKFLTKKNETP